MSIMGASFHPEDARSPGLATFEKERCFGPAVRSQQQQRWRPPSDEQERCFRPNIGKPATATEHQATRSQHHEHHWAIIAPIRSRPPPRLATFRVGAVLRFDSGNQQHQMARTSFSSWLPRTGNIPSRSGVFCGNQQQRWRSPRDMSQNHEHHWFQYSAAGCRPDRARDATREHHWAIRIKNKKPLPQTC